MRKSVWVRMSLWRERAAGRRASEASLRLDRAHTAEHQKQNKGNHKVSIRTGSIRVGKWTTGLGDWTLFLPSKILTGGTQSHGASQVTRTKD